MAQPAPLATEAYVPREVLVQFRPDVYISTRDRAISGVGAEFVKVEPVLGYLKLLLPPGGSVPAAVNRLQASPGVLWAEPNVYYHAFTCADCPQDPNLVDLPANPNQWGVFKTGAYSLWRSGGDEDSSVVVGIVDTGIDNFASPHPDLAPNVLPVGHDFVDDDSDPTDVGPGRGHGTHVAGIAAAAANTIGGAGVGYCARILVVRAMDCSFDPLCPGTSEDIADGVRWAADHGARVVNLSVGGDAFSHVVKSAVLYALSKRAIVVAASGNDGASTVSFPARLPFVVAVGATDASDAVPAFSNYGDNLDVVAPGVGIWSTYTTPSYTSLNGTSMAAPFVSGIAALIAARNPAMPPLEFERYIEEHTKDLPGSRDGHGRVDFTQLEDWSDAQGYADVGHDNYLWEWLGADASAETSAVAVADADGRPNREGPNDVDGSDDGVFPGSFGYLPYQPAHLSGASGFLDVEESVCRFDGPRYGGGAAKSLHVDSWFDWNSDGTFVNTADEHEVVDHVEDPASWGGNSKTVTETIVPPDEHIKGNPLVVRTRLGYAAAAAAPDAGFEKFGEVEDDRLVNFVEDFDASIHVIEPGLYMDMGGGWGLDPDPNTFCLHHGTWEFATTHHPGIGIPCNGGIEAPSIMSTPVMDWREYTEAHVRFWFCHGWTVCSPGPPDMCRVRIDRSGMKTDLFVIPFSSGPMTLDLTPFVGDPAVKIEFVEETDWQGWIAIDDVVVWAFDEDRVKTVTNLAVSRTVGDRSLDLTWTAPDENDFAPAPPAEPTANVYHLRYAKDPIATEADWRKATPFTTADGGGSLPVPAAPGGGESATLDVPSAFQTYYVALRTDDEVVNVAALSNSPGAANPPTPGVAVAALYDTSAAPGDTALLLFNVENTGDVDDTYALTVTGTLSWWLLLSETAVDIESGADSTVLVLVAVPPSASPADSDTVRVTAQSLSDPTVTGADAAVVTVAAATSVGQGTAPLVAGLRVSGANPFTRTATFELSLPRAERAAVLLYDVTGRRVRRLVDGELAAGVQRIAWDGRNDAGAEVEPGIYFVEVRADGFTGRERVVLVR